MKQKIFFIFLLVSFFSIKGFSVERVEYVEKLQTIQISPKTTDIVCASEIVQKDSDTRTKNFFKSLSSFSPLVILSCVFQTDTLSDIFEIISMIFYIFYIFYYLFVIIMQIIEIISFIASL